MTQNQAPSHRASALRLDRQLRIDGWNQQALEQAAVGVVGDTDAAASLFLLSAAALGINRLKVIAPYLDATLTQIAAQLNPELRLSALEGFYSHPFLGDFFSDCRIIVDLSSYGLAAKLALGKAFRENRAVIRGSFITDCDNEGLQIFTYFKGREWQELEQVMPPRNLPGPLSHDPVLGIIGAGIALEEAKNYLMGRAVSPDLITYSRKKIPPGSQNRSILVVGAGALGNFVGLGLAFSGFSNLTFMDPDVVEPTNLNRQIFFYDAVGRNKAPALAERLNQHYGTRARGLIGYFGADTDVSPYDIIIDCVDNFETRVVLSEKARDHGKLLISGGTGAAAGQVIVYDPARDRLTPAELLGLSEIIEQRDPGPYDRSRLACIYQPNPAVIMTNQIVAGLMVDAGCQLLAGVRPPNVFYENGAVVM
ncbi:MAG: ThiF family adenylyltransferase [Deltaproteobacteria bacterium]|nr:ThiF family adenylyltransferase [Deltaproteobacteria bacterium]